MPCLIIIFALMVPRLTLVVMWLLSYTATAFDTRLWPLLGFIFMPYTTCAYAIGMNANGGFTGWSLILLIIAILFDLGSHGGSFQTSRSRRLVD
ncbi:MAG: hypothetical protein SGI88_07510 [Candidatus Hydrogenedentes bacterium]|nr:hypothetical protein [Candidatus Hydrogenedentota bacterium]